MDTFIMDGKQIREVTAQGIIYLDENGEEKFIDFVMCYENYVRRRTTPESWERHKRMNRKDDSDWEEYLVRLKNIKVVGERDILGWRDDEWDSYIEFYTDTPIRFTFTNRGDYDRIVYIIRKAKWWVFNLT